MISRRLVLCSIAPLLVLAASIAAVPPVAHAQAVVVITEAPPPLPVYAQPIIPDAGYLWAPGYWAWGPYGYYWVPGTWVRPPAIGLLWTPGYWGWVDGRYFWHVGYWGPHIGFYGGINYGFGYFGVGYLGGRWDHGAFFYNRSVNNFGNRQITNVYNEQIHTTNVTRASFNGGTGGTATRPTAGELSAAQERHVNATSLQTRHEQAAAGNHAALASVNHGHPGVAATARPAGAAGGGNSNRAAGAPAQRTGQAQRTAQAQHTGQAQHTNQAQHTGQAQHSGQAQRTGQAQRPAEQGGHEHERP